MITEVGQYRYVTGDIGSVRIDGNILPLRDDNCIRGEDICYLAEVCCRVLNSFSGSTAAIGWLDSGGTVRNGAASIGNAVPGFEFSKRVSASQLKSVAEMVKSIYTMSLDATGVSLPCVVGGSAVSNALPLVLSEDINRSTRFVSLPSSQTFVDMFGLSPFRASDMESSPDMFAEAGPIRKEHVLSLFADISRLSGREIILYMGYPDLSGAASAQSDRTWAFYGGNQPSLASTDTCGWYCVQSGSKYLTYLTYPNYTSASPATVSVGNVIGPFDVLSNGPVVCNDAGATSEASYLRMLNLTNNDNGSSVTLSLPYRTSADFRPFYESAASFFGTSLKSDPSNGTQMVFNPIQTTSTYIVGRIGTDWSYL